MAQLGSAVRKSALIFKIGALVLGAIAVIIAVDYVLNELSFLSKPAAQSSFGDIILLVGTLSVSLTGMALIASFPRSIKARFPQRLFKKPESKPTYGFTSVLAIGLGATLGSPLFILIPLNIIQYEFVSLGSLLLATVLSILMAKVYANMYTESIARGLDAMGGPSFTKLASGARSVRYFIARLSMWIANTALAAYSKIVFIVFDFELMPGILSNFGVVGFEQSAIVWTITGVFVGWTVLNALFEQRFLRMIGYIQIVLTAIMVVILVWQSYLLGSIGSWNMSGILSFRGDWPSALIINTGYLYLLFFGFQEIQALERDVAERTTIPIVSWIKRGYTVAKSSYLGIAMILSVLIAAAINIAYAVAVYALHPSLNALLASQIPALFLAHADLGAGEEILTAIAFLTATITTFVPAFLAASRHLSALAEDGFVPRSVSSLSYVFTLAAILILAVGNENFLIDITDFLVLISLGIICLSSVWLRKHTILTLARNDLLPVTVGASCFVAGAAIYFVQGGSSVAIFGSVSLAIVYLIYDVYELGWLGTQLFLGIFDGIVFIALLLFPRGGFGTQNFFLFQWLGISGALTGSGFLSVVLMLCTFAVFVNLSVDLSLRSSMMQEKGAMRKRTEVRI